MPDLKKLPHVFLPCRAGSERVLNKNTRVFAGIEGGLVALKLRQLLECRMIGEIIVSTNDNIVCDIANGFNSDRISVKIRPDELCSSSASTDDLVKYVPSVFSESDIVLWTHVTSPFVKTVDYDRAVRIYFDHQDTHDSLMSVTKIQKFIWDEKHPLNYARNQEKWPQTQTLPEWFLVDSAVFINSIANYRLYSDRIGIKPYFYCMPESKTLDIDWEDDFKLAEALFQQGE